MDNLKKCPDLFELVIPNNNKNINDIFNLMPNWYRFWEDDVFLISLEYYYEINSK